MGGLREKEFNTWCVSLHMRVHRRDTSDDLIPPSSENVLWGRVGSITPDTSDRSREEGPGSFLPEGKMSPFVFRDPVSG